MKKRILSVILAVAMVLMMTPSVMAADTTLGIKAENVSVAKGTATVEVDIEITSNPGVATLGFNVGYDSNALTLKGIKNGVIFEDDEIDSNIAKNPFIISAVCGTGNKTAKGTLVTLVFGVKNTSATGTYDVTLSENSTLGGYYNYNEKSVPATLTSGSIQIKSLGGISGTVKSFGSSDSDTTVELISGNTVASTKKVTGNSASYSFPELDAGGYTVRASKTKHAPREYEVTVESTTVTQNVEIRLYGDVTGDGVVNNTDILQINRHTSNLASVFDTPANKEYLTKLANITGINGTDKTINNNDVLQIKRKNANMTSAFDNIK